MAERRYLSEMTAAQAAANIETALDKVSKDLDQISVREWDSQPVRDMRNREQELHSALVVLRDMESNQGAFKLASTALEAPGTHEVTVERYEIPGGMRSALEDVISYLRSHGRRDLVRLMQELYTAISPWDGGSCSDVPDALVPARPDAEYLLSIARNHRWPMLMRAHIKAAARLATAQALEAPAAETIAEAITNNFRDAGWSMPSIDTARVLEAVKSALGPAAAPQAPAAHVDAEMLAALQAVAADVVHVGAGENTITDAARAKVEAVLEKIGAPWPSPEAAPAAPAVDAWLQPDDMAALQRFHETAEDDESYDIGKEAVARLCAFGCLQSHSFGRYSTTDFGDYLLDTWAGARTLPFTTAAERAAQAKEGGAACA